MEIQGETFLTNRGYAILKKNNEDVVNSLKKTLTVTPKVNPSINKPTSFSVYRESDNKLYIPKYYGLQSFGVPTTNKITDGISVEGLIFKGNIRETQKEPAKRFLKALDDPKKLGGIISLPCGYGKTILALYLASVIKKKTLVVCHKEFLGNQWRDRIIEFLPTASIGQIKQKKIDVCDKDIVIASLHSIAMRDYDESIFKDFGFVIFDEAHHLSAEVFSQCLPKTTCKRMLGLSATLKRKDGLTKVFEWYLGEAVYEVKRDDNDLQVIIKRFYDPCEEYSREVRMSWSGQLNFAKMINNICDFPPRNYMIVKIIKDLLIKDPHRHILILSERRNHLVTLEDLLKMENISSIGFYVGGMKQTDLDKSAVEQILLGTFQLAQEGMDVPTLNTLILASPVSSIEQAIGRIQRQQKHTRIYTPVVIDIIDEFSVFEGQGRKRRAFYVKNKYDIKDEVFEKQKISEHVKYGFVDDSDEDP